MNRPIQAMLALTFASMFVAVIALVATARPLAAAKACSYTGQASCGCSATATNPATGATCHLSNWSCGSSGNVCEQSCTYTC